MSSKSIPNLSVTDGFDFVKKIWGSLPLPSGMSPTTDLNELDKRIADLKAVEQWLNINLSMLRTTIHGLEVQRGTIATIQSFGASFGLSAANDKASGQLIAPAVKEEFLRKVVSAAIEENASGSAAASAGQSSASSATDAMQETSKAMLSNATAWWSTLQDQFNKVASAAISNANLVPESDTTPTKKTASPTTAKTANKTANKTAPAKAVKRSPAAPAATKKRSTRSTGK